MTREDMMSKKQQLYRVADIPQVQLGRDLGLGRWANWAVHGSGAHPPNNDITGSGTPNK